MNDDSWLIAQGSWIMAPVPGPAARPTTRTPNHEPWALSQEPWTIYLWWSTNELINSFQSIYLCLVKFVQTKNVPMLSFLILLRSNYQLKQAQQTESKTSSNAASAWHTSALKHLECHTRNTVNFRTSPFTERLSVCNPPCFWNVAQNVNRRHHRNRMAS